MRKQVILFGSALFVLVLAGCGNKTRDMGAQNDSTKESQTMTQGEKKTENGLFSGSIKDLMAKGDSMQCTFSLGADTGDVKGTVYVDGNNFSQDFSILQPEMGEVRSYVMGDGEWIYQWNSVTKMGTKIRIAEMEKIGEEAREGAEKSIPNSEELAMRSGDFSAKSEYDCKKWNADPSKFKLPSDIQFNDLSQMKTGLPFSGVPKAEDACQMCESLPAEAKTACLQSCNK